MSPMSRRLLIAFVLSALIAATPVHAGAGKSSGADPDGAYSGKLKNPSSENGDVEFDVERNGRRIDDFDAVVVAVCTNPDTIGGIEVIPVAVSFDRIGVRRNGRFLARDREDVGGASDGTQSYELSGNLTGTKVRNGSIVLDGVCDSDDDFAAKRRG